jgi:hypothetical protein
MSLLAVFVKPFAFISGNLKIKFLLSDSTQQDDTKLANYSPPLKFAGKKFRIEFSIRQCANTLVKTTG